MSKVICIAGESGSGKTTSMRNLDPKKTYYFNCDLKALNWKGWNQQYNKENKNYCATSNVPLICRGLNKINGERPEIKYVIIDTLNSIMADDEMRRSKEKGYDKWIDLAQCVWDLVTNSYSYRDDLTIIYTAHTQTERDESGYMFTRIKTNGKKLDKLCLESRFTTVLIAKAAGGKYIFETQARNSTAKSPMGAFEDFEIENDIVKVIKALEEY